MPDRYPPISPKCPHFLHGGDYNPEQWPPDVWDEDMRLMKLARCNAMTVGIFAWVHLEPAEGHYTFDWLDRVMDMLADNGAFAVLATPSAAQPAWLSARYPEVLRVGSDRVRRRHGARVSFCPTSPVFRDKCAAVNERLAERYRDHPALLAWHVSNEYSSQCHCDLCQSAFRRWLRTRYGTLEALNAAWWNAFWGHTFTDWRQVSSPAPPSLGESTILGLNLDWKRFGTDRLVDFFEAEAAPLRRITADVPVTTNLKSNALNAGMDYRRLARRCDVVAWDCYPLYHARADDVEVAAATAFAHDAHRTMKAGRPFMMMESTPSSANWMPVMKLKRPGVHRLASLQAVAHGADTVQYFQWRKGRGGWEKFHGAVVDHCSRADARVFREVAEVGEVLARLDDVIGTTVRPAAAIVYDWENRWAVEGAQGPRRQGLDYLGACVRHYRPLWRRGLAVDVVDSCDDFAPYRLLAAPMLYMIRPGVAERIEQFVRAGGVFVTTWWSGIVDERDLCFTGGWPGPDPLRRTLGVWAEELDVLYDDEANAVVAVPGNPLGLRGEYAASTFCDLIHAESAEVLATYARDFYAGRPALTVNRCGDGRAYYIASRNDERFCDDLYGALALQLHLPRALDADLPDGVTVQLRTDGRSDFLFLLNFTPQAHTVDLGRQAFTDMLTDRRVSGSITLAAYGSAVLRRPA